MKRMKWLMPCALVLVLAAGCNNAKTGSESPSAAPVESENDTSIQGEISDFFPMTENTLYTYERNDMYQSQQTFVVYKEGDKVQRLTTIPVGGFVTTEVIENTGGELILTYAYASSNFNGLEYLMDKQDTYPVTLLKEPLQLGNSWETNTGPTIQGIAKGVSTITGVDVEVDTPYGTVKAMEVSIEYENEYTNVEYYAKGIGLVKSGYYNTAIKTETMKSEEIEVDVALKSIEEDSTYNITMNVYYPDENVDLLEEAAIDVGIKTNSDFNNIFESALKNPTDMPHNQIISENTKIKGIIVERETIEDKTNNTFKDIATVTVNLSGDFVADMNAGSGYERLIMDSIENTFKNFYKAENFILMVENEPYIQQH